jgi:hypothetical protein
VPLVKQALADLGRNDLDGLQIVGTLPVVRSGEVVDLDATMQATGPLVDAGVTDFRVRWGRSGDPAADQDQLSSIVQAFRSEFRTQV